MPTTRKKVIKTVYKDEDDSEAENAVGDFSDSGSEAEIPEHSSSDEDVEADASSADEFDEKSKKKPPQVKRVRKPFAKEFINKINRQSCAGEDENVTPVLFSVKDLTEEDKLLPSVLNLSESDSSEDESPKAPTKKMPVSLSLARKDQSDSETETNTEYKDVWAQISEDNSEEIAKKTFMELEKHKTKIEETKASILSYTEAKLEQSGESNVKDLLAMGEEALSPTQTAPVKKGRKVRNAKEDSDSEMEDWEEVKDAKLIPQQGLQLVVDFPDAAYRKTKKLDVEMMMKRKINRVKKEYQVYMHKVHVLCWLGHGNYVSKVLNDQDILAAVLSLVPSKECYPGERVDMKYVEQITTWFKDKLTLKQDRNEGKFRPKAPPLKNILLEQIKSRVVTTKKFMVFIFVSMLRALGLQCRVMFNFVTLPLKPPTSELCSLSTKPKDLKKDKTDDKKPAKSNNEETQDKTKKKSSSCKSKSKVKISQLDGNHDSSMSCESDTEYIMQLDGNDDISTARTRSAKGNKNSKTTVKEEIEDVSPPKRARKSPVPKTKIEASKPSNVNSESEKDPPQKRKRACRKSPARAEEKPSSSVDAKNTKENAKKSQNKKNVAEKKSDVEEMDVDVPRINKVRQSRQTRTASKTANTVKSKLSKPETTEDKKLNPPKIIVTDENGETYETSSKYFNANNKQALSRNLSLRKRSQTDNPPTSKNTAKPDDKPAIPKARAKSATCSSVESQYFNKTSSEIKRTRCTKLTKQEAAEEDKQRVSHRDILAKNKAKPKNDITKDLVNIIKNRVKEAKEDSKKGLVKGKIKQESDKDSDHLPVETSRRTKLESDEDFKPTKISPGPSTSKKSSAKKIDRRVLSSDSEEVPTNKCDVWCEIFVEELEQWIAVDVIRAKVHCTNEIYARATHPVCYVVGWDNNNYLKDVTRRYVPHWNTVTRKLRAEPGWWDTAVKPWRGPRNARDREEDEQLNRMQLEAPLPKSIAEYKNHPLYALKRHLLKFEALYPPDAATLGFVRGEPVYARECVHLCHSRNTWLKEAKVVRPGEQPYKLVKSRPKWDKLSNKIITPDEPLEVFGPWQVSDYVPPAAENGVVPRNEYGNVELFKPCMLPKGTVHITLPGLPRVANKLNIDCAPALTGFDSKGGWPYPVYEGFVVCQEFEQILTEAWLKDQEDQERREREKIETRVYGNWRRLIKGLLIRERLKHKYGFEDPALVKDKKKKGPRLVVRK